jgi:hypothetical protein
MITAEGLVPRTGLDWLWFTGISLGMLALYASTLCPTVYWYDSAELATAAALLGIPHPPGYPVYTLLGRLYVLLVPGEPAFAVNVMSAVHGALCVGLMFLIQRRLHADRIPALFGAMLFGTGASFWLNCSVAEVYTTGLVFALVVWLLLLDAHQTGRTRLVLIAAFLGGLGFAAHMFVATLGLGYVLLAWHGAGVSSTAQAGPRRARPRILGLASLAALAGASAYLYLPLRISMQPAFSSLKESSFAGFVWMLSGGNYKHWFFDRYDRVARLLEVLSMLAEHLTDLGLVLGVVGLCVLIVRQRAVGLSLLLALLGNLWFFFDYDVHDVEVFFLPSAALLAVCVGPLLTTVRGMLARKPSTRVLSNLALGVCLAYVALRVAVIAPAVDLSEERSAQQYGETVAAALPPGAVVINCGTPEEWKYRTVFDYYFQKALGQRPDVMPVDIPEDVTVSVAAGAWTPDRLPPLFERVFASNRPVYMYAEIDALRPLFAFSREGLLFRLTPR